MAASVILSVAACNHGGRAEAGLARLPPKLHGLPQVESLSGDEARAEIGRLHGRSVAPRESRIGFYGSDDLRAVVYVSRFASGAEARDQLIAMDDRIGPGRGGFDRRPSFEVRGIQVHAAVGHGGWHYFYALGPDVVWLAVPPALARPGLAELFGVDADAIPRAAQLSGAGGGSGPRLGGAPTRRWSG